ncbi:MAG: polyprenyl synthetase family protein, partial [Myxococcales bacterium]|nr:polyprenyl synthetase family protein [Myxococcales bacterium]
MNQPDPEQLLNNIPLQAAGALLRSPAASGVGPGVPAEVWERALIEPTTAFLSQTGKGFRGRLVSLGWMLAGGRPGHCPSALYAAIELLHSGSLIVDDIEDAAEERRGVPALHRSHGVPIALNAGNWMYFAGLKMLASLDIPAHSRTQVVGMAVLRDRTACVAALQLDAIDTLMRCHNGQALDIATAIHTVRQADVEAVVRTSTTLKTGSLMGLALRLGARAATDHAGLVESIGRFGEQVGIGLQMLDDVGCVLGPHRRHKALEDLHSAAPTWAWAWSVEGLDELSFARLQRQARGVHRGHGDAGALLDVLISRLEHTGKA